MKSNRRTVTLKWLAEKCACYTHRRIWEKLFKKSVVYIDNPEDRAKWVRALRIKYGTDKDNYLNFNYKYYVAEGCEWFLHKTNHDAYYRFDPEKLRTGTVASIFEEFDRLRGRLIN